MPGFLPAVLLFCMAGQFDINGLLTLESRVGQAPLEADGIVRWGVIGAATPDVQLSYLARTLEFRLDYVPRIFWREPNDLSTVRPLILHVGTLAATAKASRRLQFTASASVSDGEADYTVVSQVLGATQAAQPSVTKFFSVTSTVSMLYQVSRLSSLSTSVTFLHSRPLGAAADALVVNGSLPPFPRQTAELVVPAWKQILSRQNELTLFANFLHGTYSGGIEIYTIAPQARWQIHLSPEYDLRVGAGVSYAHIYYAPDFQRLNPDIPKASTLAPVGELGLDMRLYDSGGTSTTASVTSRLDYYVDPVLETAGPRALFTLALYSILNPRWLVGAEAGYATVFVSRPAPGVPTADETVVYANLPVRYRASDQIQMEFGFRYADRGPSVEVDAFGFHQRQLWLYYLVTASTRRPTSRKVQ